MTEVTTRILRMTSDSRVCVHRGATPEGGLGRRTTADLRCSPGAQSSRSSASSTNRHRALTWRSCSGSCTSASSSAGLATTTAERLGPGDRDVEPVQVVEEVHPAGRVGRAGAGHRVDHHRRLLPLELVDGADARARPAARHAGRRRACCTAPPRARRRAPAGARPPSASTHEPRSRSVTSRATTAASCGLADVLSACTVGTQRRPLPASAPGADDALPLTPRGGARAGRRRPARRRTR